MAVFTEEAAAAVAAAAIAAAATTERKDATSSERTTKEKMQVSDGVGVTVNVGEVDIGAGGAEVKGCSTCTGLVTAAVSIDIDDSNNYHLYLRMYNINNIIKYGGHCILLYVCKVK